MNEDKEVSLLEILVKTSYQTQVTHPSDRGCERPVAFGSGFIVNYDEEPFFVTADHVLHPDDYFNEVEQRTWTDYVVSIFNYVQPEDDFLSTVVTPLGGFYYMEQFHLDKPDQADELVDVTLCKMTPAHFKYPFYTDRVQFTGETIEAKERKWPIKKESFVEPQAGKSYFIYGKIKTKIEGIQLRSESTLKEDLVFINKSGDYYLFNTKDVITDRCDWEGLSGSPVISVDGDCVGVLCSVNENSKSVWVMPISKVKMLIELAKIQDKLEEGKNKATNDI